MPGGASLATLLSNSDPQLPLADSSLTNLMPSSLGPSGLGNSSTSSVLHGPSVDHSSEPSHNIATSFLGSVTDPTTSSNSNIHNYDHSLNNYINSDSTSNSNAANHLLSNIDNNLEIVPADSIISIPKTSFARGHHGPLAEDEGDGGGIFASFWQSNLGRAISELKYTRLAHAIKKKGQRYGPMIAVATAGFVTYSCLTSREKNDDSNNKKKKSRARYVDVH